MQVSDLNPKQRTALDNMSVELITMGVMWGIQEANRLKLMERAQKPDASMISAADIIAESMGDFGTNTADIKPSTFDDFLVTLD